MKALFFRIFISILALSLTQGFIDRGFSEMMNPLIMFIYVFCSNAITAVGVF